VGSISSLTRKFFGVSVPVRVAPLAAVEGVALGVGVALAAAALPAFRATRRDISAELQGRAALAEAGRRATVRRAFVALVLGMIALGVSELARQRGGLDSWQLPAAYVGMLGTMFAFFALYAFLTPLTVQVIERSRLVRRGPARVALANLSRDPRRTGAMAAAVGVTVAFAVILTSVLSAMRDISGGIAATMAPRAVAVNTLPFTDSDQLQAHLSPAELTALKRVPGVSRVDRQEFIEVGHGGLSSIVAVGATDNQSFPYPIVRGPSGPEVFRHGEVLVGVTLARSRHLRPGSDLVLDAPGGLAHFRVGAIWANPNDIGHNVTVPIDVLERVWGLPPPSTVIVQPAPGVSAEQLVQRIAAAHLDPDLRLATHPQLADQITKSLSTYLTPTWVLQRGMLLVTFIAVLSTLLLVGVQRRRELGLLGALGMAPDALARTAIFEAGAVGLLASVFGVIAAIPIFEAGRDLALFSFGVRTPFRLDLSVSLVYVAIALAVVLVGALLPAWRTSQLEVVDALRYE
jgi:putative ABC transport system permease protein